MKDAISGISPALLWEHFYQMSQIPRCSKDEAEIRKYVLHVAERNNLTFKEDEAENIVVFKPATPGLESAPLVVLQSHLDMVCEKNKETVHDFSKDPIKLIRDGDWISADGTTLGSDNGIGAAAALAVLESEDVQHGPLELLFTIDEETGLTGATNLSDNILDGRILLNMDSEEDGAIYIGCAGGRDTELYFNTQMVDVPAGHEVVRARLGGLQGGHSGLQIIEELGNAIKLIGRFLWQSAEELDLRLMHIDGGSKHNAIPRECDALISLPSGNLSRLKEMAANFDKTLKDELRLVDPDVFLRIDQDGFENSGKVLSESEQKTFLNLIYLMPHGVMGMSHAVPGLVESSTNFAVVKTHPDKISILTSQRSSVMSALDDIAGKIVAIGQLTNCEVLAHNGYPGWEPNPDSPVLKTAEGVFQTLFSGKPEIKAIHAGLECGIIGAKYPGMDMISFGPTILGAHSPDERVQISTVEKFWNFLVAILEKLGQER